MVHKICSKCGLTKRGEEYYKDNHWCKTCTNKYYKQYRQTHKEALRERNKQYRQTHPNYSTQYYHTHKKEEIERNKRWSLKTKYGLTLQQLQDIYNAQDGICLICDKKMILGGTNGRAAYIDHDHKIKQVRGLICTHCNRGLGGFEDNVWILHKAIQYLNFPPGIVTPEAKLPLDKPQEK